MRSTLRLFLAVVLFTAVAGIVTAQDASAAPPPVPEVTEPVAELPVIPVPEPEVPVVEPAIAAEPIVAEPIPVAVEPIVPATVEPPVAAQPAVTTVKRVTKKTAKKPAEQPVVPVAEPVVAAAPLASKVETTANTTPPEAAASTAPLKSIAPAPPSVQVPDLETSEETKTETTMGIGGWLIAGVAVAALFAAITLFRRRRTSKRTSIVDLKTLSPELNPVPVTRP